MNTAAASGLILPAVGEVAAPLAISYEGIKAVGELTAWEGQCRVLVAKFETGTINNAEFDQLVASCPEILIGREEVQRVFRAWYNDEWPSD